MDARHSEDVVVRVVGDHGNLESGERTGVAWRFAWVVMPVQLGISISIVDIFLCELTELDVQQIVSQLLRCRADLAGP